MPAQIFCSEVLNADELEIIHKNILVLKPKISCTGKAQRKACEDALVSP